MSGDEKATTHADAETADATPPAKTEHATTNKKRDVTPPAATDDEPVSGAVPTGVIHDGPNERVTFDGKAFEWSDKTGNANPNSATD